MDFIGIGLRVNGSKAAVALYMDALGLELGYHVLNDDGSFFHSELNSNGKPMLSVVESTQRAEGYNPVQLGCTFESKEALEKAFTLLKEGGRVEMEPCTLPWSPYAAEVLDRFGVNWYLSLPQHRPQDDFSPKDM